MLLPHYGIIIIISYLRIIIFRCWNIILVIFRLHLGKGRKTKQVNLLLCIWKLLIWNLL